MFHLSGSSIPDLRLWPKDPLSSPHALNARESQEKRNTSRNKKLSQLLVTWVIPLCPPNYKLSGGAGLARACLFHD
jgi:hypothetical protein